MTVLSYGVAVLSMILMFSFKEQLRFEVTFLEVFLFALAGGLLIGFAYLVKRSVG
ncbi:hypothetical protein [Sphingomonas arenae]|uniref:hypothetical protein n=1 Tax=Sphingomonas arenae TaxID=2812555 RepID=UPI00196837F3|nr:hypothetical protein [Sphingomonas arenae]